VTAKQRRVLAIVATDRTFEPSRHGTAPVWVGACIHCKSPLTIDADGTPVSAATIEHIWPQRHGGGNDLDNLALACGRCNRGKGARHDVRPKGDARLLEIVEELRRRRRERWREPPAELASHVAWAQGPSEPPIDEPEPPRRGKRRR
jgi:HNH endonuclease